ncbi:MAG: cytochrome c [Methyloceanibacter sp.]|nr:cytochrome c [Methyloceanibacter sp.]
MRTVLLLVLALIAVGALAFYLLTIPVTFSAADLPDHTPDVANGKMMFIAGGCAECHAVPVKTCDGLEIEDETQLAGSRCLKTDVGTFHVPNISPDPETGIGGWSTLDFVNAMKRGVAPGGVHLYPSFPYTSYQRMRFEDLIDLKAYLDTLPPVRSTVPANALHFPYNIRRGVGLFQRLYVDGKTFEPDPQASQSVNRGGYLVMGPGHCVQCHSPRNALGGIIASAAFAGAKSPSGKGDAPNIGSSSEGIGDWSQADIAYFLETGSTPDFDVVGDVMVPVQENMARLPAKDREAIAAFLKTLPPGRESAETP